MKIILILFSLILCLGQVSAQEKYFIYFKDKGISEFQKVNIYSPQYNEALNLLTPRAVERRKKISGDEIIDYSDIPVRQDYLNHLQNAGIEIVHKLNWFNCVSAFLNDDQIDLVKSLPFVKSVERVKHLKFKDDFKSDLSINKILFSPGNVHTNLNYGNSFQQLYISEIPAVHDFGITGHGVVIGLLDSGFDWKNQPSLKDAKVLAEYDFVFNDPHTANESNDIAKQDEHGTYVLSILGGYDEGEIIGSAYGASFLLAKTEDVRSELIVEEDNYAAGLEWMESMGVDITTSSLGYSDFDDEETSYKYEEMNGKTAVCTRALEFAFKKGIVTISSAGNEGNTEWKYITAPADGFNVISVGAITKDSLIASFSSRGPSADGRIKPEVVANGVSVYGANKYDRGYYSASGTSASSPIVAGIAGLLLSVYPHLNNQQVRKILIESASHPDNPDNDFGYGIASAKRAVEFPNLLLESNTFTINKIFVDNQNISTNSVWFHYKVNGGSTDSLKMNLNDGSIYQVQVPQFNDNDEIAFYFSYLENSGGRKTDPAALLYSFEYGSLEISLYTNKYFNVPDNFYLSQNYPNPFNSHTTIEFSTVMPKKTKIVIYNILGQKIKELFNGLSDAGLNYAVWNGTNDAGGTVASGPYLYCLELDGNLTIKKMIFLK